jgi:hypothetical protein
MFFAVDIDGTIATTLNQTGYAPVVDYYKRAGIGIPETIANFQDLIEHPYFIAYRKTHEDQFQALLQEILESPAMMFEKQPLPHAIQGVTHIAQTGRVAYYTVRKSHDEQRHRDIQETTKQWLSLHQFPNPGQVVFCMSVMNKLVRLYHQETQDSLVLIDDRFLQILEAFELLVSGGHPKFDRATQHKMVEAFQQRLVVVAFGVEEQALPESRNGLQLLALASWGKVTDLIASTDLYVRSSR